MTDERGESKPAAKTDKKKNTDTTVHLSPEELRAISGGTHGLALSTKKPKPT